MGDNKGQSLNENILLSGNYLMGDNFQVMCGERIPHEGVCKKRELQFRLQECVKLSNKNGMLVGEI